MYILILGATGRLGRRATDAVLAAGHDVVALARDPGRIAPRAALTIVAGDVRDEAALSNAVTGVDAVIAALGPRSNASAEADALELGMRRLIAAMERHGIERLIALSGAGVDVPGDRKPALDRVMSKAVRLFARHVIDAKQREFDLLSASTLAWTALRPPLVVDGAPSGYRLSLELHPGARVTRADVGQALADQLADRTFIRSAPFVLPAPRG